MNWKNTYDNWKLASPYDDYKPVKTGNCEWCEDSLYIGDEVIYEKSSENMFCNRKCYEDYVKHNIGNYIDEIMECNEAVVKVLEL